MSFRYPLDTVKFTQGFGDNPDYYKQYGQVGHNGYDMSCNTGTPVYAAENGTIYYEGKGVNQAWMGSIAGICCIIDHGSIYTGYAHLSNTVINKGQTVTKGQLIGHSGMTGVGTGPHLHFEFIAKPVNIKNGYYGRVDPAPYLVTKATPEQIKQAYLNILEHPASADNIAYWSNYTNDFMVSYLSTCPEKQTLEANKILAEKKAKELVAAKAAQEAAAKATAEADRLAELARIEAENALELARIAEQARLDAIAEAKRLADEKKAADAALKAVENSENMAFITRLKGVLLALVAWLNKLIKGE